MTDERIIWRDEIIESCMNIMWDEGRERICGIQSILISRDLCKW